jgi:hypothetical protein
MSDFVADHLWRRIILQKDFKGQDNISERKVNREGETNLSFQQVKEDLNDNPHRVDD